MKISISRIDKKFSLFIRSRDNWTCQRCDKRYIPPTNALHCAHIFTRGAKSTRFNVDNCVSLCYGCHSYLDSHPLEKYDWYSKKYGKSKFERIRLKSHLPEKLDYKLIELWLDETEKAKSF